MQGILRQFEASDSNNEGYISAHEFQAALRLMSLGLTARQTEQLSEMMTRKPAGTSDGTAGGGINYKLFVELMLICDGKGSKIAIMERRKWGRPVLEPKDAALRIQARGSFCF